MLFHRDIGFPADLDITLYTRRPLALRYSSHARRAAAGDRYGAAILPQVLHVAAGDLVEAEVLSAPVVTKLVVRTRYSATLDLVLVVLPCGFVKTVWFNKRDDQHGTLDRSKYAHPTKE
jgi:hypothetical protein